MKGLMMTRLMIVGIAMKRNKTMTREEWRRAQTRRHCHRARTPRDQMTPIKSQNPRTAETARFSGMPDLTRYALTRAKRIDSFMNKIQSEQNKSFAPIMFIAIRHAYVYSNCTPERRNVSLLLMITAYAPIVLYSSVHPS
jgi:hypothetical protein